MDVKSNSPLQNPPADYCPPDSEQWFEIPDGLDAGKRLFYYDHVTREDETPKAAVLFVHGNPECSYTYRHIRDALITSGQPLRLVAMDHIGLGLSDSTYDIDIDLDALVPVQFNVVYKGVIPVDTMADIEARTTLNFKTLKHYRNLKIKAKLPLKFDLPVTLNVPVKDTLHFHYKGAIKAVLNQNLKTRVNTVLNTTLPVDQIVKAPVTRKFGLRLHLPQTPVRAVINHSDMKIDLDTLKLSTADDNSGPERMASPYGPAAKQ